MEDITIKSVTHCPTCNSECKVNGGTTQYYVPVKKYTEDDIKETAYFFVSKKLSANQGILDEEIQDFINSLNKQDK